MDITYIPMARGFVYLAVVLDWFSRRVLSWRLSITMEAAFCRRDAGGCDGPSRQAGDFTYGPRVPPVHRLATFTGVLANSGIAISMDGKGAWRDNVFVERLWRSVKDEEVYLRAYDSVSETLASIGGCLDFTTDDGHTLVLRSQHPIKPTSRRVPPLRGPTRQRPRLSTRKFCSDNRDHLCLLSRDAALFLQCTHDPL